MSKTVSLWLLVIVFVLSIFENSFAQEPLTRGEKLINKARSLNSDKLDRWIARSIKKNGRDIIENQKFQEILIKNIKTVMVHLREKKPRKPELESGIQKTPGPMWLGGISYSATFAKPADTNGSMPVGSGQGGGGSPGALGGNTQTLLLNNIIMLDQQNSFNLLYMRFIQQPELPSTGISGLGGASIKLPTDIWGGGHKYKFSRSWSTNTQLSYSNANGLEDPSLGIGWQSLGQIGFFDSTVTSLSLGATAPLSENSKKYGKTTTTNLKGSYSEISRKSSYFFSGSFAYSSYNKKETEESILANLGLNLGGAPTVPGDPSQGFPDITQSADIDLNLLSREVTKTTLSTGGSYNVNRKWSVGSNFTASYSYLESTYSVWSTSIRYLQSSYRIDQFRIGCSLGATSPTAEKFQFPENYSVTLSLSYNFGKSPPGMSGGSMGDGGSGPP